MKKMMYDLIGIGIGPFNLGLAALTDSIDNLNSLFFDLKPEFDWHGGMMLEGTKLQVPFHADLVTLADPQSPFSFLCYLKAKKRLFRFTIREEYFPLRSEYNDYCKWVCEQLENLRFNTECTQIEYDNSLQCYLVNVIDKKTAYIECYHTKHLIIGIGTTPYKPSCVPKENRSIMHSSMYMYNREYINHKANVTLIGSGQSAAEIFNDLLDNNRISHNRVSWFSRSSNLFPMDYSKFALEMTSPDYIDYFYSLTPEVKKTVLNNQKRLYKGINEQLISSIYDKLYALSIESDYEKNIHIQTNCALENIFSWKPETINCQFFQTETREVILHQSDVVILATGYESQVPEFLRSLKSIIQWDKNGRYAINRNYSIDKQNSLYIQNAELDTHGFNAPDLGMGPYRNAIIINSILGYTHFEMEREVPFQQFKITDK